MKWQKQPRKTGICGQIAVSVITNRPLKEVIDFLGHGWGTKTPELIWALRQFGFRCNSDRLLCLKKKPHLAIAKVTHPLRKKDGIG